MNQLSLCMHEIKTCRSCTKNVRRLHAQLQISWTHPHVSVGIYTLHGSHMHHYSRPGSLHPPEVLHFQWVEGAWDEAVHTYTSCSSYEAVQENRKTFFFLTDLCNLPPWHSQSHWETHHQVEWLHSCSEGENTRRTWANSSAQSTQTMAESI